MLIVCILGKSGSGKSTLEHRLEEIGYSRIVSYTTRDIREGEENHREYHFVTEEQFDELIKDNVLIEHAEYNGKRYGAPKPIGSDKYVIVVEPDGLKRFVELYGNQVMSIYLDSNSNKICKNLNDRNDTDEKTRADRVREDEKKFDGIENIVDYVIDGNYDKDSVFTSAILAINDFESCSLN